jgi:hypothetical protein
MLCTDEVGVLLLYVLMKLGLVLGFRCNRFLFTLDEDHWLMFFLRLILACDWFLQGGSRLSFNEEALH